MKNKFFATIFVFINLCSICFAANAYQFEVLSTTDMHGRCVTKDITTGKDEPYSMQKVATVVKRERKKFGDKILLIDNGDVLQGTLISQYAITEKPELENPMITAFKYINYDVWVIGNHEFNYSQKQRDKQVKYALDSDIAVLGGNIVLKSDGLNIYGEKVKKGSPFYAPYFIKTFDFGDGKIVRVAVIGFGNANNANWDKSEHYPNLQFNSLENPNGFLDFEVEKWVNFLKRNNLADIIIVSAHSGKSTDDGVQTSKFMKESQVIRAVENTNNLDLMIYGHDHQANLQLVKNKDGKEIYIVNGGGTTVTKNVFTVYFDKNGKIERYSVTAEALPLTKYNNDKELTKINKHWYDETYNDVSKTYGKFDGGWNSLASQVKNKTNKDLVLTQTEVNNLIHKLQIWASWQQFEKSGKKGAQVSLTSSSMAANSDGIVKYIPKDGDKISKKVLAMLYVFGNNTLCTVDMTPQQLYAWMNEVANKLEFDSNGKPTIKPDSSLHGTDTFYGIDYAFDLSKPEGQRVVYAKIENKNLLEMKQPIRVVMNNFRLAGAHNFRNATGLTQKDIVWQSEDTFGETGASVQSLGILYVKSKSVISPKDTVLNRYNSFWKILPQK